MRSQKIPRCKTLNLILTDFEFKKIIANIKELLNYGRLSPTCKVKFDVFLNRNGNILQPGETVAGKKTMIISGFDSNITADELINTENSSALHNGVAGLMWLFSGTVFLLHSFFFQHLHIL